MILGIRGHVMPQCRVQVALPQVGDGLIHPARLDQPRIGDKEWPTRTEPRRTVTEFGQRTRPEDDLRSMKFREPARGWARSSSPRRGPASWVPFSWFQSARGQALSTITRFSSGTDIRAPGLLRELRPRLRRCQESVTWALPAKQPRDDWVVTTPSSRALRPVRLGSCRDAPACWTMGTIGCASARPAGARQAAATAWLPAAVGDEHS